MRFEIVNAEEGPVEPTVKLSLMDAGGGDIALVANDIEILWLMADGSIRWNRHDSVKLEAMGFRMDVVRVATN